MSKELKFYNCSRQFLAAVRKDIVSEDFELALQITEAENLTVVQRKNVRVVGFGRGFLRDVHDLPGLAFMNHPPKFVREMHRAGALRAQDGYPSIVLSCAIVGSYWFDQLVWGRADIYFIRPRVSFENSKGHFFDYFLARYPFQGKRAEAFLYDWKTGEKRGMVPATPAVR